MSRNPLEQFGNCNPINVRDSLTYHMQIVISKIVISKRWVSFSYLPERISRKSCIVCDNSCKMIAWGVLVFPSRAQDVRCSGTVDDQPGEAGQTA